jgi:hypothetical protein
MRKLDLEELKKEYVDVTFNWLTVLDVLRDDRNILMFRCKCRCGTIVDSRKQYVLSGHTTSCGCYKCSHEKGAKYTEWCKNNPDKVKVMADKYSQWCKNNPDKVKEKSLKRSKTLEENPDILVSASKKQRQFWKDNPDKLAERTKHRSETLNNNPEIQLQINQKLHDYYANNKEARELIGKKLSELYSSDYYKNLFHNASVEWCKNNPDKVAERGRKQSDLYKNNPDVLRRISESSREYWSNNHDEALLRGAKVSKWCKNNRQTKLKLNTMLSELYKARRTNFDFTILLEIIHPDYIMPLMNGDIKSGDIILTMCPNCNKYDKHTLSNVYHISYGRLKLGHAPLCCTCRNKLMSSSYELEIADYISTFYSGELIRNSRDIISPFELDLYYPEKKIAIEFNGDYWHDENHKPHDYHYNKYILCRESKILLVSIFESEWNNRKDVIKQYLLDLFSNRENSLSFNDEHTMMNNNYPSINNYPVAESYIEDIYYNGHFNVYTCGYSKIL